MSTGETIEVKTPAGNEAEFFADLRGGRLSAVVDTEQNPSGEIEGPFTLFQGSVAPPPDPTPPPNLDLTKPSLNDSARFNDNGKGVRGDLKAVVEAILMDYEARAPHTEIFKLKEPIIKMVEFANGLNLRAADGRQRMPELGAAFGQRFFNSPTVFNFFRPDYSERGPILDAGLVSPEFQIFSSTALTRINAIWGNWIGRN